MTQANAFDSITQLLIEQKLAMERLEQENNDLRHQISNLKRGIGITITVDGSPLHVSPSTSSEAAPASTTEAKKSVGGPSQSGLRRERTTDEQQMVGWNTLVSNPLAEGFVL